MTLVASPHAGISRWIGSFLLATIVHAAARSQRRARRDEVVVAAVGRLQSNVTVVQLTSSQGNAGVAVVGLRDGDLVLQPRDVARVEVLLHCGAWNGSYSGVRVVEWAVIQIICVVVLAYRLQLKSVRLLLGGLLLPVAKVGLLHHHRRTASKKLVLHLHITKVRLRILVYLYTSFRPHL